MEPENAFWCSACHRSLPILDFRFNKQGKRKKTCYRHEKKHALPMDQWDNFMKEIGAWNTSYSSPGFADRDLGHSGLTNSLSYVRSTRNQRSELIWIPTLIPNQILILKL